MPGPDVGACCCCQAPLLMISVHSSNMDCVDLIRESLQRVGHAVCRVSSGPSARAPHCALSGAEARNGVCVCVCCVAWAGERHGGRRGPAGGDAGAAAVVGDAGVRLAAVPPHAARALHVRPRARARRHAAPPQRRGGLRL
eukprot:1488171-Rhodomonas_salina.2